MAKPLCIPAILVSVLVMTTKAQLFSRGSHLVKGCEGFQDLEFIKPYNKSEEKMLGEAYFGDLQENVSIPFAQRGSCHEYKGCLGAGVSSFYLCSLLTTISRCMGFEGWPALVFDNCTDSRCEFVMTPAATKCLYFDELDVEPVHQADACGERSCNATLGVTPMRELNGSHCLIPLPKGTTLMKQMECSGAGSEPWMRWWFDFHRPVSKAPFACLWLSRCKNLDDPLDFVCMQGEQDAVQVLRGLAEKRHKDDEFDRNASMSDIHDFTHQYSQIENGCLRYNQALLFPRTMIVFFVFFLLRFLL